MTTLAACRAPALARYKGDITNPERWGDWTPRAGDILVCTPPKSGTTWTQTILSMLVHGGPDLPEKLPILSPWIDADLGQDRAEVAAALDRQPGRRVVKTHTPADGFPIWDEVTVVAVYRHPLDVFLSLRKHVANRTTAASDHPMIQPLPRALDALLQGPAARDDFDRDTLATLVLHYCETARSGRLPDLRLFHYADMLRNPRAAVARLAEAIGLSAENVLIDTVTEATSFGAMQSNAAAYAPVAGTGFWKSDAGFFDAGGAGKWVGELTSDDLARYHARLEELLPDAEARHWLEHGTGTA